jgi:pimeloyl-ACP methyl ester carboxylesterase
MARPAGVPLVLIHGVGLDHTMWRGVMTALPDRRTIAYDMLGHGNAAKPPGPYTLGMFVDQLSNVVDALDCDVDLVGFSMGAMVAQSFALSPGGRHIHRLVLLNGVHDRSAGERQAIVQRVEDVRAGHFMDSVEPALERWFTPAFAAEHFAIVATVRQRLLSNDLRAYADAYEVFASADADLAARTAGISVPTLVATGGEDQRSTPAMAAGLAATLPHGRVAILPNLRHLTPIEAPDEVAALIDHFTAT